MGTAQEFLVSYLKDTKNSYDTIEEKTKVSKSTISRMMKGQSVSIQSMRLIADAYGILDDFLSRISEKAESEHSLSDVRKIYEDRERMLLENCEEHLRSARKEKEFLESSLKRSRMRSWILFVFIVVLLFLIFNTLKLLSYYIDLDLNNTNIGMYSGELDVFLRKIIKQLLP